MVSTYSNHVRYWILKSFVLLATIFVIVLNQFAAGQSYVFGASAYALPLLPVAAATADFNGDGRPDLAVATSQGISILLGKPDGSFANRSDYSVGGQQAIAVGDFNGDGKLDIISVSSTITAYRILAGNGDGTFTPATAVPLPSLISAAGIVAADFNHDGKLDIAIAGTQFAGPEISVLLGNGKGTFGNEIDYASAGSSSLIAADFNSDGNVDLAVGSVFFDPTGTVSVLLGRPDGTFASYIPVTALGSGSESLAAADLNHDGKVDLVVTSSDIVTGQMSVLLGNGDGSFAAGVSYPSSQDNNSVTAIAISDFNSDGKLDVLAVNSGSDNLSIWLGKGDGTFSGVRDYSSGFKPMLALIADFNGDGRPDVASVGGENQVPGVTILMGKGDGTFTSYAGRPTVPLAYNMAVGDFNGDGRPDLVMDNFAPSGTISILLTNAKGGFVAHNKKFGTYPTYLNVGDFNGDGKLDVVIAASNPNGQVEILSTLLGNGDGTLRAPINQPIASVPADTFAVADFDLDGNLDLAVGLQLSTGVSVFFGNGDGSFTSPMLFDLGQSENSPLGPVLVADLNGDHKPDLVVSTDSGVAVLIGKGNRSFRPYNLVIPGYSAVGVGDFSGDGKPDLVLNQFDIAPVIALGNGDGTFQAPMLESHTPASRRAANTASIQQAAVGDFNGDGNLDYAVFDSLENLAIFPGNGHGRFGQRIDLSIKNGPGLLAAADFTGDGTLDLAAALQDNELKGIVALFASRPVGALYPSPLNFGSHKIGGGSQGVTTLHNSGGGSLAVSAITTTGDYSQTNTCGSSLASGSSCTITVTFTPTKAGLRKGILSIKDNAATKPQIVVLNGTGVK